MSSPVTYVLSGKKISGYLLDLAHPEGGSKAKFFRSRGFSEFALVSALLGHASHPGARAIRKPAGRYGTKLVFVGPIDAPDGSNPTITTVRIQGHGSDTATFVTAYPS